MTVVRKVSFFFYKLILSGNCASGNNFFLPAILAPRVPTPSTATTTIPSSNFISKGTFSFPEKNANSEHPVQKSMHVFPKQTRFSPATVDGGTNESNKSAFYSVHASSCRGPFLRKRKTFSGKSFKMVPGEEKKKARTLFLCALRERSLLC